MTEDKQIADPTEDVINRSTGENDKNALLSSATTSATTSTASSITPSPPGTSSSGRKSTGNDDEEWRPKVAMPQNREPTYYVGGGNGIAIVTSIMEELGWKKTSEKNDENFKLKWTELKTSLNFGTFREGEQMVNAIPNCSLLTNKQGLINSLMEYDRLLNGTKNTKTAKGVHDPKALRLNDFVPETFRLDDARERDIFFRIHKPGEMWICKPTGRNQGKGIFIVRETDEIKKLVHEHEPEPGRPSKPLNRIIQRYIRNPLLLDGKKFDLRVYMLIANCVPYLVLFHNGYVRLSIHEYESESDNIIMHLTNQFIQKKDPTYKDVKDETTWSMERFNNYVNDHIMVFKGIQRDWVFTVLTAKMKAIMQYCFKAVKNKLHAKIGYFGLYGYDFMIDEDMKIYLIEINVNPCLATNCDSLKECVPKVVKESIYISIEAFEKSRRGRPLLPLQSLKEYEVIYYGGRQSGIADGSRLKRTNSTSPTRAAAAAASQNGSQTPGSAGPPTSLGGRRARSLSPLRRTRSLSPVKEVRPRRSATKEAEMDAIAEKDLRLRRPPRPLQPKSTVISPPGTSSGAARRQVGATGSPNAAVRRAFPSPTLNTSNSASSRKLPSVFLTNGSATGGQQAALARRTSNLNLVQTQSDEKDRSSPKIKHIQRPTKSPTEIVRKDESSPRTTTIKLNINNQVVAKDLPDSSPTSPSTPTAKSFPPALPQDGGFSNAVSPYATTSNELILLKMTHKQRNAKLLNTNNKEGTRTEAAPNRGS